MLLVYLLLVLAAVCGLLTLCIAALNETMPVKRTPVPRRAREAPSLLLKQHLMRYSVKPESIREMARIRWLDARNNYRVIDARTAYEFTHGKSAPW